jgi:hypothetical protein
VDYRITNSILWGGDAVQSDFAATNFTIVYSDISEPWAGTGNLNSNPLFADAAAHHFHLLSGSPCINAGNPAGPADPDGTRADMGVFPFAAETNVLISSGSSWKYLDDGSNQGTSWTGRTFNDSSWSNGVAQLGYGDTDEATVVRFGPDPNNKYITTYFRRAFTLNNPAAYTNLALRLLRDDGAVVHLNGVEIFRSTNMPGGAIAFNTLATASGENDIDVTNVNAALPLLVAGNNVIAVEIHQQALTSTDISFDFDLTGITGPGVPGGGGNILPSVALTNPGNGASFAEPASITLDATASDSDGSVTNVAFFANGAKLADDTSAPFTFTWNNVPAGGYALTAVATDNQGATNLSAAINIAVASANQPITNTVVSLGSAWRFLDDGTDQGTTWRQPAFNDGSWGSGAAPLGYCLNGCTYGIVTTIGYGGNPAAKYITTYFRHNFVLPDPTRVVGLNLGLSYDDGAVVYLNDIEIFRVNMPAGPVNSGTPAATASNYNPLQTALPTNFIAALVSGTNVVAVEIHQGNGSSSDLAMDLQLDTVLTAETNSRPFVTLTNPPSGLTVAAPANLVLGASASDSDGSVTNVAFFANGSLLGNDVSAPYAFNWNSIPEGVYALTAAATDNVGQSRTSSVVTLTVSANTAAPVVASKSPAPGNVTSLTQISVTFSKLVAGVNASDLRVNGVAASGVTGSGSNYTFTFPQPAYGAVPITWAPGHGITDVFTPPAAFDHNGAGATWQYTLLDAVPPVATSILPIPGSTVAGLSNITVTFSEAVTGVNAADLRIAGAPASTLSGTGAGPYVFGFSQPSLGSVAVAWAGGHGIADTSGNPFGGGGWSYTLDTNASGVLISEIMYHPASENVLEEFIEFFNKGAGAVDLTGWRLSAGVQFTFPAVSIPASGYLVVCADVATFTNKYPGVANVVGNWTGFLNNGDEDIDLDDAAGRRVDSVHYADEGDWAVRRRGPLDNNHRGWKWLAEHDGLGKSLELINPDLSNNSGQNWAPSRPTNGTPGRANSVFTNNIPPLILGATHSPIVPRSSDPILVTARLVDESAGGLSVALFYRISSLVPPAFSSTNMNDAGVNGDAAANDGLYSVALPAQANNAVVEFYLTATDAQGNTRAWPAPAIAAADSTGPTGNVANALLQVDDTFYNPTNTQPLYKMIMTENERIELAGIPPSGDRNTDAEMNGTWISLDTGGTELHYLCGYRNRGHGSRGANPPNYRINFRSDDRWKGVTALNMNSVNVHVQHLGSVLARKAGVAGANTIAVQVRVNNANLASSGGGMFGSYAANEALNSDYAARHFPLDPNGSVYRAVRDLPPPDFNYRGEDPTAYRNTYFKESNVSEDDWTDLIAMLRTVGINNTTPFTTDNVRQVAHVEQWMRHIAVMNLFGNNETGLNTGFNDDYFMYAGAIDRRLHLTYYDLDTILGEGGSLGPTADIFTATANNGSGQAFTRFLHHPDFEPIYYRTLREILTTTYSQANFNALVDQTLGSYVASGTIDSIKSYMNQRRAYVLSVLPPDTNAVSIATISGVPRSPTPVSDTTLIVGGAGVVSYRYRLNGAGYGAETPVATPIVLIDLPAGTNVVAVIGKNSNGIWQPESGATVVSWVVNLAWPAVRLSEVLARNDSALNHNGTFPDAIELFNEGSAPANLGGLRLTDDPSNPDKFTFPNGTMLGLGVYLVVYANNPDATPGLHTGFTLDAEGEGVYLFDRVTNGNVVLDSVVFGAQLSDRSIGRVNGGAWTLTQPTFGSGNTAVALADPRQLKINEWLAAGQNPYPDDFIELFNADSRPVPLGGLHLTDQPIGDPLRHTIPALTFAPGGSFPLFIADGDGNRAGHVNFHLETDQGEIGLTAADGSVIDCVAYGPQMPGVSMGRCADGTVNVKSLVAPTPALPNACPFTPPGPVTVTLLAISNVWSYHHRTNLDGVNWTAPAFNDSAWFSGPALLGQYTPTRPQVLPEPIRTVTPTNEGFITFYFRAHFNVASNTVFNSLQFRHIIDDGAVFYLNGTEVNRFNIPGGPVTWAVTANPGVSDASYQGPFAISTGLLVPGDNVFSVEVHQSAGNSSDVAMGVELQGLIVTNSPVLAGLQINEVLANNASLEEPDGSKPDWVEIYNPSSNAVDLVDLSLTDNAGVPRKWVFPAGSILNAQGYRKVRFDPDLPASPTNTGFGLKSTGGAVYLINRPADGGSVASSVAYGLQAEDFSIGRVPNGGTNWVLTTPTLGGANLAAALGDPLQLKVNEWMAAPASGDDWFEIYNPNAQPVNLSRLWLSDDLATRQKYQIPPLSFLGTGPGGFLRFWAANGADADFTGFNLRAQGEAVVISQTNGTLINGINFSNQVNGVSEGRLPDGNATIVLFPTTATPGKPNFLPLTSVVINELLSHSEAPFQLEDAVELFNPTGDDVDISGWYLSDSQNNLLKYRIPSSPSNTIIRAHGFVVFYEYQFNDENQGSPFSFSSARGDEVYLSQASAPGVLTGYRASAEFGAGENGVSFGRFATSVGVDFTAMSARTFGVDNPATTNDFRMGMGKTNAYPKVGPVVFNEIMYHPMDTNDALEFVEMHNLLGTPIVLHDPAHTNNTWRVRKGIEFEFPSGTTIPAGGYLVLVSFDPLTDAASLAAFQSDYGTNATLLGPYRGKLDNNGDALELQKPDEPVTTPGPDFGLVPYIVADRVVYGDTAPWPTAPDGTGPSLKKTTATLYGNEPLNWNSGSPTPGAGNGSVGLTNTPPVLAAIGPRSVVEGALLQFTALATDAQVPPQGLTFSIDNPIPDGAAITPGGAFTWTPGEDQGPGVYQVTVRVTDNGSPVMSDSEVVTITVTETNAAPVLTPIGNKIVTEGALVTFTAMAVDSDLPAQILTYSLAPGAPAAAGIDSQSGQFNWLTTAADGPGNYMVTVRVTDNGSPARTTTETITITVNDSVVPPPLFISIVEDETSRVTLTWRSFPGKTYRVFWAADVTSITWTPLSGDVLATGTAASKTDPTVVTGNRFYRVMQVD